MANTFGKIFRNIFPGKDLRSLKTIGRVILSAILLVLTGLLIAFAKAAPGAVFSFYPAFSRAALGAVCSVSALVPIALWEVLAAVLALELRQRSPLDEKMKKST